MQDSEIKMAKIKCRIALSVNANGSYSACGGSGEDQELFLRFSRDGIETDVPHASVWVEVEVEVPTVRTVEGKVVP